MILDGPDTPIDRRLSQLGFRAAVSLSQASVRWWWPGMPLIVAPDLMVYRIDIERDISALAKAVGPDFPCLAQSSAVGWRGPV